MKFNLIRHTMRNLFIFILAAAAIFSGCRQTGNKTGHPEVVEVQPHGEEPENISHFTKIFLAGTIDMGNSIDWQNATVEKLRNMNGRYLAWNPRRSGGFTSSAEEMKYQIEWELERLEKCDIIVMNILGSSKSPITLLEMGLHMRSGKLYIACEPDFYRYDNVRITCGRYGVPLFDSLDQLLQELISSGRI